MSPLTDEGKAPKRAGERCSLLCAGWSSARGTVRHEDPSQRRGSKRGAALSAGRPAPTAATVGGGGGGHRGAPVTQQSDAKNPKLQGQHAEKTGALQGQAAPALLHGKGEPGAAPAVLLRVSMPGHPRSGRAVRQLCAHS